MESNHRDGPTGHNKEHVGIQLMPNKYANKVSTMLYMNTVGMVP